MRVLSALSRMMVRLRRERALLERDESGFTTAELLGNAALAILALLAIWGVLQALGVDVVNWIRGLIIGG